MHFNNDIKQYLGNHFSQLNYDNIAENNDFSDYTLFRKFIQEHYNLDHLKNNNYIKYVKVKRQMLKLDEPIKYMGYMNSIDAIIKIMSDNHVFPNIKLKSFLFRIDGLHKLINDRKIILIDTIKNIRSLFNLKGDNYKFKFKILIGINTMTRRYQNFLKYSQELKYAIENLVSLEESYDIDHKLIELNNMQRTYLGKKSEYSANKVITQYINEYNSKNIEKKYFYLTNVNILKLLNINSEVSPIKGELDGIIVSYNGIHYIIETIIEVKSSIKSTFDDTKKFLALQNFIKNMSFDINNQSIIYGQYSFTKESFKKIITEDLTMWTIYICINNSHRDVIEKSHLYFSNVLKIIDDKFIESFYINKNEDSIMEKHAIIIKNKTFISRLFDEWKYNIKLGSEGCNVFMTSYLA